MFLETLWQRLFPTSETSSLPTAPVSVGEIRLGLWGPKGSGKSTYIAMLYKALQRSKKWEVKANREAERFALRAFQRMRQEGLFPTPTALRETKVYEYKIIRTEEKKENDDQKITSSPRQEARSFSISLEFLDIAGEIYEDLEKFPHLQIKREAGGQEMTLLDYLGGCHGIIFLLDPEQKKTGQLYEDVLYQLMQELQGSFEEGEQDNFRIPSYLAGGHKSLECR